MAKFLKSVETLMAQVLISVYGEVLLVTGIAYHNQKDNCVGVDFYVSERQGDHLNFCVGFTRTDIEFTQADVQAFVEENAVIHGEALASVYFEQSSPMENGKKFELGKLVHTRTVDTDGFQTDRFRVSIPIDCMEETVQDKLLYWGVEEWDCAFIDWNEGLIKLYYKTEHYLPEGYEPEEVDDYV